MEFISRLSIGLLAAAIIVLGIVMGGLRLAMVNLDLYQSEISYLLSEETIPGLVFSGVQGDWNLFNPIIKVQNASITLPDRSQSLVVDNLTVEFDFWASLREQSPVVLEISGKLEKLELIKDISGRWLINENEIAVEPGTDPPDLANLLELFPRYLKLDLQRLIILDLASGNSYQFDRVKAHVRHKQENLFVQLSSALPEALGQAVVLKAVLNADRSVLYLNGSKLQLRRVSDLFGLDTRAIRQAVVDGEIWVNLIKHRVVAVNGKLFVKNGEVQLPETPSPLALDFQFQFSLLNRNSYWRLNNDFRMLSVNHKSLKGFRSQIEVSELVEPKFLSAWVDRLDSSSLAVLGELALPDETYQKIMQSHPQGRLEDIILSIDFARLDKIRFSAHAANVSSSVTADYPGIENLNGHIIAEGNKLGLELSGSKMRLDFGKQFRAPLEIERFELSAVATYYESVVLLSVTKFDGYNEDIKISGRLLLESEPRQRPFMYLRAHYSEGRGSTTSKYLPINLLPPKTLDWLDRGIKDVYVSNGELLYYGRLQSIEKLESEKSGEFYTTFNIEDADVFFAPGWLQASNGSGTVLFHNKSMEIDLDRVSYDRLDNISARVSIADLKDALLDISIKADMSTSLAFQTWVNTPTGNRYHKIVEQLQGLKGQISSTIDIQLPLTGDKPQRQVQVSLNLNNAAARADNWGLKLSDINGLVKITNEGVFAEKIKAKYFDDAVVIDINAADSSGDTIINANGNINSQSVLNRLPQQISGAVAGKSEWQIRLAIADTAAEATQAYLKLNAASNLINTRVDLPQPFAKDAGTSARFSAELEFYKSRIEFSSDIGPGIHTAGLLLGDDDQNYRLQGIDVAFATALKPAAASGLNLYGNIPYVSFAEWLRLFDGSGIGDPGMLQSLDLIIDKLVAYERDLGVFEIRAERNSEGFAGLFASSMIKGNFKIPVDRSGPTPLQVDLDYLMILKGESESDYSALLPSDLVDFRLSSKILLYHGMEFQDLSVNARVQDNTLYLDTLDMRYAEVYLSASGKWDYSPSSGRHYSNLKTQIKGHQFGQAMSELGLGNNMENGDIDFEGQFAWTAAMPDFEWDSLVGDAHLKITDGVLNSVEPGGGRLVGLLSLSALPRRLSLDFKDILIQGMEFDRISGTYRLDGGDLYTDDTVLDGPAAKIRVSGKTEMRRQTYDQKILVIPKIRQTLPVIGAVSAGSAVGWGLLLLQNLFKKVIDKVVEIEYRITGSWDNPVIELVKAIDENNASVENIDK